MKRTTEKPKMKSLKDLRMILCEEIDNIRSGKTNAANVNAITNATGKILQNVRLEMEYAKLLGKNPNIAFIALDEPKDVN